MVVGRVKRRRSVDLLAFYGVEREVERYGPGLSTLYIPELQMAQSCIVLHAIII